MVNGKPIKKKPSGKLIFKCPDDDGLLLPFVVRVYKAEKPWIDCKRRHDGLFGLDLLMNRFDANNQKLKTAWCIQICRCLDCVIPRENSNPARWWNLVSEIVNAVWVEGGRRGLYWSESEGQQ